MNDAIELTKLIDICHDNLKKTKEGRDYVFGERNLSTDAFLKYKIGFFPRNTRKLSEHVSEDFLKNIGLMNYDGTSQFSDYYSIIFPIYDDYGTPIAIAGRCMLNSEERELLSLPKYKNSKFKKTNYLFGLNFARANILLNQNAYVVEGYFDQISMYDAGIKNTVAVCGTLFSKNHFVKLSRYTEKISMFLDGDEAGQKSAESIYNKYVSRGVKLRFLKLPNGYKDAGEYFLDSNKNINDFKNEIQSIIPMECF
jgi:DNA primase